MPRLVVLDTNVVLDLVVFRDPGVAPIAHAIRTGVAVPVVSCDGLEELRRVLAYPRLKLDVAAQTAALGRFMETATHHGPSAMPEPFELPLCTDADDQKFLELAWHSNAHCLVTKDKALLRLARAVARLGRFAVLTPQAFEGYFHAA